MLARHGLVKKARKRRHLSHPGKPSSTISAPNQVWCADFKGQFKTRDGIHCYPLTITDGFSRYLIGCQGLLTTACGDAKAVFERVFRQFGLPERIRTDNRVPFATRKKCNPCARLLTFLPLLSIFCQSSQSCQKLISAFGFSLGNGLFSNSIVVSLPLLIPGLELSTMRQTRHYTKANAYRCSMVICCKPRRSNNSLNVAKSCCINSSYLLFAIRS
ncbi:MAG TPA: DDE-type integrase/transposase/recombinase [Blastocatellia bacterium]|nr:DDE-type integrase/transposase/recombinase [Blastocatellia bacterium]